MELISHDKFDNFFTFKLTMKPGVLYNRYIGDVAEEPNVKVNGKIKIFNKESCLIHGRYFAYGKQRISILPYPDDCPVIVESITNTQQLINFKVTQDIPLLIELS